MQDRNSKFMIEDRSNLIKYFASVNPLHLFFYVLPVIFILNYFLAIRNEIASLTFILIGVLYWSLIEYVIHRFIYHQKFKSKAFNYFIGSFHQYHHKKMSDHRVLNSGFLMICLILPIVLSPLMLIFHIQSVLSIGLGLSIGYYLYECVHYFIHYRQYCSGYMSYIQKYHMHHHKKSPMKNFGNTTHLWDYIFNTYDRTYKSYKLDKKTLSTLIVNSKLETDNQSQLITPENIDEYSYIFLGGILGEILSLPFVGDYLKENKKILVDLGVDENSILCTTPNSFRDAKSNLPLLKKKIISLVEKNNKKAIVFAHSKACLEILHLIIDDIDFSRRYLKHVYCVGAPLKGSSLFKNNSIGLFNYLSYPILNFFALFIPGVRCLSPNFYTAFFKEEIQSNQAVYDFLNSNFCQIKTATTKNKNVPKVIRLSHLLLLKNHSSNDGLVTIEDQGLDTIKLPYIELEADHSDLLG